MRPTIPGIVLLLTLFALASAGSEAALAEVLREHHLMTPAFVFLMFLTVATIVGSGLKRRPGGARSGWRSASRPSTE